MPWRWDAMRCDGMLRAGHPAARPNAASRWWCADAASPRRRRSTCLDRCKRLESGCRVCNRRRTGRAPRDGTRQTDARSSLPARRWASRERRGGVGGGGPYSRVSAPSMDKAGRLDGRRGRGASTRTRTRTRTRTSTPHCRNEACACAASARAGGRPGALLTAKPLVRRQESAKQPAWTHGRGQICPGNRGTQRNATRRSLIASLPRAGQSSEGPAPSAVLLRKSGGHVPSMAAATHWGSAGRADEAPRAGGSRPCPGVGVTQRRPTSLAPAWRELAGGREGGRAAGDSYGDVA